MTEEEREEQLKQFEKGFRTTPEDAAKTILNGVRRGKTRVRIGSDARFMDFVARIMPERSAFFMKKMFEKLTEA